MSNTRRRQYRTKIWRLQLPDEWDVKDAGGHELVTFFRSDGVGTLTILTTDDSELATAEGDKIIHEPFPKEGHESEYGINYSRTWILRCRGRKLRVRYSCAAKNADLERGEIEEIVRSISESDEHSP